MDTASHVFLAAHELYAREAPKEEPKEERPPVYKAIGLTLAIASGAFIGTSFVLKKMGLLKANVKYKEEAGEGYGYLKNAFWWTGMTLMIIGEIFNFVAYSFVDAILVTPLGALSVVICTILSAIFLKERLSFVGKIGCFMCIVGSVVIVLNAPEQSAVANIQDMQHFVIAPGFLSYAGVVIVGCTFIALWVGPRYGKKSMLVYLSICSLIGGLSVVATQGLGSAVVAQIRGGEEESQFKQWFLYVLFVFVIVTLLTEIVYLNKALNIFNAALVTPTYYVFFTSSTIITSAILFRGFAGSVKSIITVVLGFLQICAGVVLLQLSKSSKDVPDAAVFNGDLDQVRTVAEQEEPESEPKADAIRGTAAIIRRISMSRQKMEAEEARRIHEDRLRDQMDPIRENERVEWDGLRRRKTFLDVPGQTLQRRKTLHPPLGMAHFPEDDETQSSNHNHDDEEQPKFDGGFMNSLKRRAQSSLLHGQKSNLGAGIPDARSPTYPVALTEIAVPSYKGANNSPYTPQTDGPGDTSHVFGLPPGLESPQDAPSDAARRLAPPSHYQSHGTLAPTPPPHSAKRQFSFQNVFHRRKSDVRPQSSESIRPVSRGGLGLKSDTRGQTSKSATEEERLGLVKGDSTLSLPPPEYDDGSWHSDTQRKSVLSAYGTRSTSPPPIDEEEENESYGKSAERWEDDSRPSPELRNLMAPRRRSDDEIEEPSRRVKDWERHQGGERYAIDYNKGYLSATTATLSLLGLLGYVRALIKLGLGSDACHNAGFDTRSMRPLFGVPDHDRLPSDVLHDVHYVERIRSAGYVTWKLAATRKHTVDTMPVLDLAVPFHKPEVNTVTICSCRLTITAEEYLMKHAFYRIPLIMAFFIGLTCFIISPFRGGIMHHSWTMWYATLGLSISVLSSAMAWFWVYVQEQLPKGSADWVIRRADCVTNMNTSLEKKDCFAFTGDGYSYVTFDLKAVTGRQRGFVCVFSIFCAFSAILGYVCQYVEVRRTSPSQSAKWLALQGAFAILRVAIWIWDPSFDDFVMERGRPDGSRNFVHLSEAQLVMLWYTHIHPTRIRFAKDILRTPLQTKTEMDPYERARKEGARPPNWMYWSVPPDLRIPSWALPALDRSRGDVSAMFELARRLKVGSPTTTTTTTTTTWRDDLDTFTGATYH
ncbi:MAG: hypothetical protein Q9216_006855 [Gyalolechia sp. 2 TL-2023]